MGEAAAELATQFGWARMAAQYIALYRQLAGDASEAVRREEPAFAAATLPGGQSLQRAETP